MIDARFGDRVVFVERVPLKVFRVSFRLVSDAFPGVERIVGGKNYDCVCRDSALCVWSLRMALDCFSVARLLANSAPLCP